MTNTFSNINDKHIWIVSKIRVVLELQESKRCLETTTTNKKTKEVISFAKGATYLCSKSRIASALQSQKKVIVNQKTIKPSRQTSIAEQKTNNSPTRKERQIRIAAQEASKHHKPNNKWIMIAKHKMNRMDHHRMTKHK